jgi:hypothetical protein
LEVCLSPRSLAVRRSQSFKKLYSMEWFFSFCVHRKAATSGLPSGRGVTGSELVANLPLSQRFLRILVVLFWSLASEFKQR